VEADIQVQMKMRVQKNSNRVRPDSTRRRLLVSLPLLGVPELLCRMVPAFADEPASQKRLALVVGNHDYPNPFELPPIPKNVRDVAEVLAMRGFEVTALGDLVAPVFRAALKTFADKVRAAPPDAAVLFFFSGHGVQIDAENLLLPSGLNPSAPGRELLDGAIHLRRDVLDQLPERPGAFTMAVIDACRTSFASVSKDTDGLNQLEAPPGCLVAFATGAGKPAIAPIDPNQNTFYTASFVSVMRKAPDDVSFSEFFRLVKTDVQKTMLNHPVRAIREIAQIPYIAENTHLRLRLGVGSGTAKPMGEQEQGAWQLIEGTSWPADVIKSSEAYLASYPDGKFAASATVARDGAKDAETALKSRDVRLYRSAFDPQIGDADYRADLIKAARGDKDAAARIGRMYRNGEHGLARDEKRWEGWYQYAVELGNGIASYDLALYYREAAQPHLASKYELRARELGFTPPPTLEHTRK
jgi:hypothetical protein